MMLFRCHCRALLPHRKLFVQKVLCSINTTIKTIIKSNFLITKIVFILYESGGLLDEWNIIRKIFFYKHFSYCLIFIDPLKNNQKIIAAQNFVSVNFKKKTKGLGEVISLFRIDELMNLQFLYESHIFIFSIVLDPITPSDTYLTSLFPLINQYQMALISNEQKKFYIQKRFTTVMPFSSTHKEWEAICSVEASDSGWLIRDSLQL